MGGLSGPEWQRPKGPRRTQFDYQRSQWDVFFREFGRTGGLYHSRSPKTRLDADLSRRANLRICHQRRAQPSIRRIPLRQYNAGSAPRHRHLRIRSKQRPPAERRADRGLRKRNRADRTYRLYRRFRILRNHPALPVDRQHGPREIRISVQRPGLLLRTDNRYYRRL